jgi:hypothetical protein
MSECRSQVRVLDAELVMISWEQNSSTFKQLGNVEDLSPDGTSVVVDHGMPVGTSVTMTYGEGELTGIVRHCAPCADGYSMSIEFVDESKDSPLHFQPDLLVR